MKSRLSHLQCSSCQSTFPANQPATTCTVCGKVLVARYDLAMAAETMTPEALSSRKWDLWRYGELLPVQDVDAAPSLGEGGTPLLEMPAVSQLFGMKRILVKDESRNPTGSFKARGLCMAVSRARELGATALAIPTAGNAGSAMAAYAARAGMPAYVFMPADAPEAIKAECRAYGATVFLVNGLISDAGAIARDACQRFGWWNVSTLKEPYRVEGKKTMGFEIVEQLGWKVPDAMIFPTGGGTGIVGVSKAFDELEAMGLIGADRPRLIVVQAEGCAPIVEAFVAGERHAQTWHDASTIAAGLRVPGAIGDYLILDAIRSTHGTAMSVSDQELIEGAHLAAATEGLYLSPEAGAAITATKKLRDSGYLDADDEVVILGTGAGMKHTDLVPFDFPVVDPSSEHVVDTIRDVIDLTASV
jgi:threonine synthase